MEVRGRDRAEDRDKGLGQRRERRQRCRACQNVEWGWAVQGGVAQNGNKGHAKLQDKANSEQNWLEGERQGKADGRTGKRT